MQFLSLGEDLTLRSASRLAKWWTLHKIIPIYKGKMGILITKSPKRSTRGFVLYDVYLRR